MKRFILICLVISAACCSLTAKEQFIYTQISRNKGLTSTINCIYKEKDGDVWLGTPNGLYSFNSHDLRHYDDTLLADAGIFQISQDKEDRFWILTDNWIFRKGEEEDSFTRISAETDDARTPMHSLLHDEDGIWLGSNGKIYRYTYEDDRLFLFKDLKERPSFICRQIHQFDSNTLLCCSHNGAILLDITTGEMSDAPFGPDKEVSATLADSKGRIWMAFYNKGICVYSKDGRLLKTYTAANSGLTNDIVLCLTERDSAIWAGTDGGGINIIYTEDDRISVLSHIPGDPSSFPAHSINSIYNDHYGNIWAGSIRDGLIRISRSGMKTYKDSHIGLPNGLSNPTVLCLFQDDDSEYIWIGTDGEGLNRFDPATNTFTHYRSTLKKKVVSIARYSDTELALSVYSDRLWIFDMVSGELRPLDIDDRDINYLLHYAGRSLNLANDKDGRILLISNTIHALDKVTGRCIPIDTEDGSKAMGNFLPVGRSEDGLWLHDYYNIYFLRDGSGLIEKKGCTGDNEIKCGHVGKDGEIWLATGTGLCRFDSSDGTISSISTNLFTSASSVVCDNSGRVWIGTEADLFAYLADIDSFALFGESDGASPNEFLSKPHLLTRAGDVFMGGVHGLLIIDSDYTIDASEEPSITLQGLVADNKRISAVKDGEYVVPADSKMLDISVSTQEKDIFRNKIYRFMFSDGDKVYESSSPTLTLQDLPKPGRHEIFVSCTRRNGDWSHPVKIMTLRIPQPWYFTGWFIAVASALILIFVTGVVRGIMHRKESQLKLALKEQEQKVYEEKVRLLINISHELRTPLTLVMAPLKRLLNETGEDEGQSATLHRIYRQSRRMRDLLDMVLDLRKMEVGGSGLKIEKADFNKWVTESISDIADEEKEAGINVVTDLDSEAGIVGFDKKKCDTVLTNILMNAIKHSSPGDTIRISTAVTEDGMVRTSISDQGPGLGDIDRSRMFTRFYQSNSEQYGSGIGLSYSKILVELHGGRIGAENNTGKGATFWWEIPLDPVSDNAAPARAYLNELVGTDIEKDPDHHEAASFDTSSMKLMIVDDNQDLLDFLTEAFISDFSEIITAVSGNSALSALAEGRIPDIIVSDVNMPDGDGYSLCRRIKESERFSHIPVVLLTARGEEKSQSDSYRMGADAFLAKPFETETLMELLRNILMKKEDIRRRYLDTEDKADAAYGSEEEDFIIRLNRIISDNIGNPDLDQKLLCREMGMSRVSLYNKMKSITGAGAKEYITKIRIEKAKSLIENSEMNIAEISDRTGFSSQSYFSTAFKSYTGMSPSQYRNSIKQHIQ